MQTLHGMLLEMMTWFNVEKDVLDRAEKSGINNKNNKALGILIRDWSTGQYDEEPEIVLSELLELVPAT
jgi:hypothetical protein